MVTTLLEAREELRFPTEKITKEVAYAYVSKLLWNISKHRGIELGYGSLGVTIGSMTRGWESHHKTVCLLGAMLLGLEITPYATQISAYEVLDDIICPPNWLLVQDLYTIFDRGATACEMPNAYPNRWIPEEERTELDNILLAVYQAGQLAYWLRTYTGPRLD